MAIITRFEKARILGARALQIALGAPTTVLTANDACMNNPIQTAEAEFGKSLIPMNVLRTLPDGEQQRLDNWRE